MTLTADRVRAHSAAAVLRRIDDTTTANLARMTAAADEVARRLRELDAEWDTDRTLEIEAATMGLTGQTCTSMPSNSMYA